MSIININYCEMISYTTINENLFSQYEIELWQFSNILSEYIKSLFDFRLLINE